MGTTSKGRWHTQGPKGAFAKSLPPESRVDNRCDCKGCRKAAQRGGRQR